MKSLIDMIDRELMDRKGSPTYANQLTFARELLQTRGREALNNPHAMIGRTCGCQSCFCCAAAEVCGQESTT